MFFDFYLPNLYFNRIYGDRVLNRILGGTERILSCYCSSVSFLLVIMKPLIDFDECLRDSPKFREQLETEEASIEALELKLEKVLKTCAVMVDTGKTYVAQKSSFTNALWDLSAYFAEDAGVMAPMNRIIHALQEMNKFHGILLDQASRTVLKNLNAFVKVDIKGVKESKHYFEKISNDLDVALNRNSQVSRSKAADAEEAANLLSATRSCFRHTALDYVHTVTMLQARKRHEILATLLSYMQACCTYHHQGADLSEDLDPFLKNISGEVATMRTDTKSLDKEMENRHTVVNSRDTALPSCDVHEMDSDGKDGLTTVSRYKTQPRMQGYLFKRTSNAFKTWNRRWFYLYDNRLVYRKRTGELNVTVMEEDLRLCTVRTVTDGERRFCFEVLSPTKSHMLQADSEDMLGRWVQGLQNGIRSAIQQGMSRDGHDASGARDANENATGRMRDPRPPPAARKVRIWEQLLSIPGNNTCCDCGAPHPRWASINLGVTLCIECSGVHRSLGVHHSKVRSLTLDDWEPDIIKVMAELGNKIVNQIYEANAEGTSITRPTPQCETAVRETWIRAKYVSLLFVRELLSGAARAGGGGGAGRGDSGAQESPLRSGRRWSVRRARRRFRSPPSVPSTIIDEKSDSTSSASESPSGGGGSGGGGGGPAAAGDESVLIIGGELVAREPLELALPSDQDSTEGEDTDDIVGEEEMSSLSAESVLYRAAEAHNVPVMLSALAARADVNAPVARHRHRTPLHAAIASGSVMACSFLLVNGSKLNAQDEDGNTPLHLATQAGHTAQVCLFLKYRANQSIQDNEGRTPLDIAIANANADIVTLLRLTKLNDEMKESEMTTNDDTYNEVVRDYTHIANSHPERLLRNQRHVNNNDVASEQAAD